MWQSYSLSPAETPTTHPTISQQFAALGAGLRWDALPDAVQRRARLCLLDMLGATLAGATTPTAALGAALAARYGAANTAQLVGRPQRASAPFAALANGMTCHALELDDGHRYAVGLHNAATTTPAALACAEEVEADLATLLAAIVLGYEVAGRVGTAVNPAHRRKGFHSTGTIGVFGAAAAAAYLRRLPAAQFARALGIAGSAAGGLFEFLSDGATSKHFHGGHAAMSGVLAADLAAGGLTGPLSIFEGEEGFCHAYAGAVDTQAITAELGSRFNLEHIYFKLHAACAHIFSPIDAVLALRAEAGDGAAIERLVVRTYHAGAILDEPQPRTKAAAKFSIPYCIAAAWLYGRVSEEVFGEQFLADPALRALAARVAVAEDSALEADFPRTRAARVEVLLRDGRRLERYVEVPRGMPDRPVTEQDLTDKFLGLAAPLLGPAAAQGVAELVLHGTQEPVRAFTARLVPRQSSAPPAPPVRA
jgi:2-methylcitrate dehydratase PrpD